MLELADIFRGHGDGMEEPPETGVGGVFCGQTDWFHGDLIGACRGFERTIAAYRSKPDCYVDLRIEHDAVVASKNFLAIVLWALGDTTRAGVLADEAMARAIEGRHPTTMANNYLHRWIFEMIRRRPAEAYQNAQANVSISREHGLILFLAFGTFSLGCARWQLGEPEAGMSGMREGMNALRNQGIYVHAPLLEMLMAEAEAKMGRIDAAIAMIDEQLIKMERTGQRWVEGETHRIRGQMLLDRQPSDHAAAEVCFRRAIEIARVQQTKSFELRATLALAKLYHATDRDKLVPELLAPALAYFNKGGELPELEEAHRLLDSITGSSTNLGR
jgi:predicted ATPase